MSNTDHSTRQKSHIHLAEFIKRTREEKGFKLRTVVELVRDVGHRISVGYLSGIESGVVTNPASAMLKALAFELDVSEKEMFEVMQGTAFGESEEFQKSELAKSDLRRLGHRQ